MGGAKRSTMRIHDMFHTYKCISYLFSGENIAHNASRNPSGSTKVMSTSRSGQLSGSMEPVEVVSIRFSSLPEGSSLQSLLMQQAAEGSSISAQSSTHSLPQGLSAGLQAIMARLQGFQAAADPAGSNPGSAAAPATAQLSGEHARRISSQVASSIFADLISGAFRPGDVGPPPASTRAIDELPCCPVPKAGTQVRSKKKNACTLHACCAAQRSTQRTRCPWPHAPLAHPLAHAVFRLPYGRRE